MGGAEENQRAFIANLARENQRFYDTPDGRGALRAFELTFEHRWIYLYELVQNALDAGARSIALRIDDDGDALIFQHDGGRGIGEREVEGLSKIFRSTKGASTVGFMGIGFKSVFGRFREALVSGWGWTFRYEISQEVGRIYGDVQPDILGAVLPIWDGAITEPAPGFTTRFGLRRRADRRADLKSDLARFLPDDDRTPLAILAASGLQHLDVEGRIWELDISEESDGSLEATALSAHENLRWHLFPAYFEPSKEAVACFLEHRRIQPSPDEQEQVYKDAARVRRVLGVLPLDDDGRPAPSAAGRIYATLPTDVTVPFGLHIDADWLLNISRVGLREIEDNPWQREITDRITDILASFVGWAARTFSEQDAVRGAFRALAPPSSDKGGLEALLAGKHWLSRLRQCLVDEAVFPVWTAETDELTFAKPGDTIVPPAPLAKTFEAHPSLRPAVLLKGPVLMNDVLGTRAIELFRQIDLLTVISPRELARAWRDGLESWWELLPGESADRHLLLFRLWAAIAELGSKDEWKNVDLPCVRTVTGEWVPVSKAVYFREAFPTEGEPGGSEVHRFIQPFIPDARRLPNRWINALRRGEAQPGALLRARRWIEEHARGIGLKAVVRAAVNALGSSTNPDWSVLVPLGHWAKHRNRVDLLTHALVESEGGPKGVPFGEALLAGPYVERDRDRRRLFPSAPVIAATYLEQDPKKAGPREWRAFLEEAGARGALEVRPVTTYAGRFNHQRVAEFLGLEIGNIHGSNNDGYTLSDFEIEPALPDSGAPEELRAVLAAWLDDGFSVLQGRGRRRGSCSYYGRHDLEGTVPSAWVTKLSELAWVPCGDGELKCPRDVLSRPDPAREDAPVAGLSSELVSVLEREGVKFGTAIPEAPSLRRLSAIGSRLDATSLAQLIRECREQVKTEADRRHFERAVRELMVPSRDNGRVPLDRIVRRVGRSLRGALGGWIVPLDHIEEVLRPELEHSDFPHAFPDTTTGEQALTYIRAVWARAGSSPERLANEVRNALPSAYAYCLEDRAEDTSLSARWDAAVPEAAVFAEREWVVLTEVDAVYFDDINDRRFLPGNLQLRTVTSGHLGNSRSEQLRTAQALGLRLLSSSVEMEWRGEKETLPVTDEWISRFALICSLLRRVRSSERAESDGAESETGTGLRLSRVRGLALEVGIGETPAERVPVNARLHENMLTLSGRPIQFGADAAKELLRHFSFGQRASLAADLAGMMGAIDDPADFNLAADKFRRAFAPDFELPPSFQPELNNEETGTPTRETVQDTDSVEPMTASGAAADEADIRVSNFADADQDEIGPPIPSGNSGAGATSGSFTKGRALAAQNALAKKLRSSLRGEIVPSDDAGTTPQEDRDSDAGLGDETYRSIVAQYERESGREPEIGASHQTGWDIRSVDPETGDIRLIEVKGKGRPWTEDEVVELSRAQVREAFAASDGQTGGSWYLYVVEKLDDDAYRVLPIPNPVDVAAKWILCGESWRWRAEGPKRIANSSQ